MDEISKELRNQEMGIAIDDDGTRIGCLLWVDDVILLATSHKEHQQMLTTTDDISKRYHIEFGKAKSKSMKKGRSRKKNKKEAITLGTMTLEETDHYKYLGHIQTKNNSLDKHIKMVKGKVEAAYQKILSVAGSATYYEMEMETIWATVASNIIPIITYSGETWEPTKKKPKTSTKY